MDNMRNEITAAVLFLVNLIVKSEKYSPDQLDRFQRRLVEILTVRFENHWFPDKPTKGQGYRCILLNRHGKRDATIACAARAAGVRYDDLSLPVDFTLWIDPKEVCYRFGEKGSCCTLASFGDQKIEKVEKQLIIKKPVCHPVTTIFQQKSKAQSGDVQKSQAQSNSFWNTNCFDSIAAKKRKEHLNQHRNQRTYDFRHLHQKGPLPIPNDLLESLAGWNRFFNQLFR